jgi:hypothetical protein
VSNLPLQITFQPGEIEEYLRIDPGQDAATIATMKKSAMDEAETFLNTDFSVTIVNADGTTTTTATEAPPSVKEWVLDRLAHKYENRGNQNKPSFGPINRHRKYPFKGTKKVEE